MVNPLHPEMDVKIGAGTLLAITRQPRELFKLEINRYIGRYLGFTDILVSASIGVDKTLIYSSLIQATCARKYNEASQDSYLTTTLAHAVS